MTRWDDSHIWEQMAAATTDDERHRLAGEAVEFHRGFITQYGARQANARWDRATCDDYHAELIAVAYERALTYDVTYVGEHGKATFPTYLRPYLWPVKWRVGSRQGGDGFTTGVETARLVAGAHAIRDARAARGMSVGPAEIAEELSGTHGKRISPERVARLLSPPETVYLDAPTAGNGCVHADVIADQAPDPAEVVVDELERTAAAELVRDLLEQMRPLSDIERCIIVERLMAPPRCLDPASSEVIHPGPMTLRAIGARFGVSDERVRVRERRLLDRMRAILDSAATHGT